MRQLITESPILKAVLIFFLAYLILFILWLQVKETFGYGVTLVASKFVAAVKDAQLEEVTKERNIVKASFRSSKGEKDFFVVTSLRTDTYASNLPLTLSILASLFPFIRRKKRAYTEALLLLLLFDLLDVFWGETWQLTSTFMANGIEKGSFIRLSVYNFVWGLTDYVSISFAPFLLVTYIFLRFRR